MSFLNLRIRGRLYGGFGVLLLFCAALAGFAVWQFWGLQTEIIGLGLQSRNTIRVVEIGSELHANRRALLRYVFDHDEASFAESEKRLTHLNDLLEEAIQQSTSDERRAIFREVIKDVADLKAQRLALGETVKRTIANRDILFSEGDKMAADLQQFVDAAEKTSVAREAAALETKVLLVRVANWRLLATKDAKGVATFKSSLGKAQQVIAELEKADDLPANLATLLATVKAGVGKYADAFEKTSANLLRGDELYYKAVTPPTVHAISEMEKAKVAITEHYAKISREAQDHIATTTTLQEIVAGAAVMLGVLIAFLIARGIVGPLSGLTSGMRELAGGNFGVVLPGLDRKDEVGDMAQAVEAFKVKAEEKARDEAEARIKQDQIAARQRKADMIKLADDFEAAVGEIVETVSSASTELEASASTLTSTADRAQELTTMVAAASEEASTNVQSVASATEKLGSSVNEISRQVQESARMANEAVGQARKRRRVVEGGKPNRRCRRTDQHHRGTDQSPGAQCHHRSGARRGSRSWFRGRGLRGQGAGRADRQGHRRDRPADRGYSGGDAGVGGGDPGDQRHHRKIIRSFLGHRRGGGTAGRGDPGDFAQRAAGCPWHPAGLFQHHRRAARCQRDRLGLLAGAVGGAVAVGRQQPPQARSRQVPQFSARGLTTTGTGSRSCNRILTGRNLNASVKH